MAFTWPRSSSSSSSNSSSSGGGGGGSGGGGGGGSRSSSRGGHDLAAQQSGKFDAKLKGPAEVGGAGGADKVDAIVAALREPLDSLGTAAAMRAAFSSLSA